MEKLYLKVPISKLKKNPLNAKLHKSELIEDSISSLGNVDPPVCDENFVILSGHGRLDALLKLGYKEIEVIMIKGWTEQQKIKYMLVSNKAVEAGGWSEELLAENFSEDELLSSGWESEEIDALLKIDLASEDFDEVDAIKEVLEKPLTVKVGDLYLMGGKVICPKCKKETEL